MVVSYALRGSTGFGAAAAMPLLGLVIPLKVLIPAWTLVGLERTPEPPSDVTGMYGEQHDRISSRR